MSEFNFKQYLKEGKLIKENPSIIYPSLEDIQKEFEEDFIKGIKQHYYLSYNGTPISDKGKLKIFKTEGAAKGYAVNEANNILKYLTKKLNSKNPGYNAEQFYDISYIDTYPEELKSQIKDSIMSKITIEPIFPNL